jgi:hypothetical protein
MGKSRKEFHYCHQAEVEFVPQRQFKCFLQVQTTPEATVTHNGLLSLSLYISWYVMPISAGSGVSND